MSACSQCRRALNVGVLSELATLANVPSSESPSSESTPTYLTLVRVVPTGRTPPIDRPVTVAGHLNVSFADAKPRSQLANLR